MDSLRDFECYDHLLVEPLKDKGWLVDTVSWRNPAIDWNNYDAVIIRSTWDYQHNVKEFLSVLETIDRSCARLANSLELVCWNIEKTYLKEIKTKGIQIVPTCFVDSFCDINLSSFFNQFHTDELIIKPVVSANADNTFHISKADLKSTTQILSATFCDRPFMVQPFMQNIVEKGEISLFYFGSVYSHAILKTPKSGDFRAQEEHGSTLKKIDAENKLLAAGYKSLQALPELPLYTRIDFVQTSEDDYALMEIELIEPSLYFNMDGQAPARFIEAFESWINGNIS